MLASGVQGGGGHEVAAHDTIRLQHHEAEGMERLSAEYLTLATEAQAERWDALLAHSGLSDVDLANMTASAARGPLFAGLREAEARGLDVEALSFEPVDGVGDACRVHLEARPDLAERERAASM